MLTSTARFLVLALVALASASAKTFNMDPQFAIHTISNEYQLFLIETLVKNVDATLLSKVTPVKKQVEEQLASGKTGLYAIAKQIGDLIVALDKAKPGFQDAILEYGKKNPIAFYSITNIYPEASWDFLYAASKKAATELKSDKIAANLEKLNDDFEATFHGGSPDATKLVAAFDKFTEESEAIAPGYGDLLLTIGDAEVDKYRAKLLKLQQQAASGQSITDEQLTAGDSSSASPSPSPSPSTEKAAEKTEKPTASPAGSTTGEIATSGNVTDAPTVVATTAPVVTTIAPTATPKSSASSHSAVLTVIVSVAVAAITSFAI